MIRLISQLNYAGDSIYNCVMTVDISLSDLLQYQKRKDANGIFTLGRELLRLRLNDVVRQTTTTRDADPKTILVLRSSKNDNNNNNPEEFLEFSVWLLHFQKKEKFQPSGRATPPVGSRDFGRERRGLAFVSGIGNQERELILSRRQRWPRALSSSSWPR